jgi:polyhydroxybutyrate depolymerase
MTINAMVKNKSYFVYVCLFAFICACSACKPSAPTASYKPLVNPHYTGCGIAHKGTGSFVPMKTRVLNQDRTYYLRVPSTYDASRAYPLIFRWHGAGGNALSGGLDIESSTGEDAIIVSADGLNNFWQPYDNSTDLPFFDNMLETISNQYCIDSHRVFSYGFSVGGSFSNLLACQRSDVLRASAAIASGIFSEACTGKVATWLLHDQNDDAVPIATGKDVLERVVAANGCSANTVGEGNGCVKYQGCDAAPVVWCESKGFGHNIRGDYAPAQVWRFFQSLP